MLLSLPSVILGAKRLGAKRLGGETTWGESTWGRIDLGAKRLVFASSLYTAFNIKIFDKNSEITKLKQF